jgi:hypothetical protein
MRCRECAAEVPAARVCSRCGAPIVGQQPVVAADTVMADTGMADTVTADTVTADTVVAAISDGVGKGIPAGMAGQALAEPYVPGSGDRLPAELRLVQRAYAGLACGLFASALACATAAVFLVFLSSTRTAIGTCRGPSWLSNCVLLGSCWRPLRSRPVSDFPGCSDGPAIHTQPR